MTVSARVEDYEEPSPTTAQTWIITASITCSGVCRLRAPVLTRWLVTFAPMLARLLVTFARRC